MVESDNYSASRNFMTVGKIDRWAIIDVRPLRRLLNDGTLTANDSAGRVDKRVERHF